MTYDATTPVNELMDACDWSYAAYRLTADEERAMQAAAALARAELARRSELAAKYERLTRALAGLKRDLLVKPVCVSIGYLDEGEWDESSSHPHDGTPDGIAAAIIAAAEEAK